jgi:hypothetical protein
MSELPTNTSGKVRKFVLQDQFRDLHGRDAGEAR